MIKWDTLSTVKLHLMYNPERQRTENDHSVSKIFPNRLHMILRIQMGNCVNISQQAVGHACYHCVWFYCLDVNKKGREGARR